MPFSVMGGARAGFQKGWQEQGGGISGLASGVMQGIRQGWEGGFAGAGEVVAGAQDAWSGLQSAETRITAVGDASARAKRAVEELANKLAQAGAVGAIPKGYGANAIGNARGGRTSLGGDAMPGENTPIESANMAAIRSEDDKQRGILEAQIAGQQERQRAAMDAYEEDREQGQLYREQFMEQTRAAAEQAGQSWRGYAEAAGAALTSVIQGEQSAGQAVKNLAREWVTALAQRAAVAALWEGAEALGSLAIRDMEGAALHGAAAVKYAAVGTLGYVVASAFGAGGSGGGGSTAPAAMPPEGPRAREAGREQGQTVIQITQNFQGTYVHEAQAGRAIRDAVRQAERSGVTR
jgi:hypothetical protein